VDYKRILAEKPERGINLSFRALRSRNWVSGRGMGGGQRVGLRGSEKWKSPVFDFQKSKSPVLSPVFDFVTL
jgi:hypothetical protein